MHDAAAWWIGFNVFVAFLLFVDLGVFHRKAHEVGFREAIAWSVVWVALALVFNLGIYLGWFGGYDVVDRAPRAKEFLAGYLIEKALSVDNIFVFAVLFRYFAVPPTFQHRVLFLGILGAVVLRLVMILAGIWLIERFEWVLYIFAAVLIYTGFKMLVTKHHEVHPERNPIVKLFRKLMPVSAEYHGQRFFVRQGGRLTATPLLLVLVFVEATDVVFALDSIPAILLITRDPFIAYTSNVFAILGLRAMYFALVGFMRMFVFLSHGLAVILIFIGGKMVYQEGTELLLGKERHVPIEVSLGVIAAILSIAVIASLIRARFESAAQEAAPTDRSA